MPRPLKLTPVHPGHLITPTRGVRGTITASGDRLRITAEVYTWGSGKTRHRTSVEGAQGTFFGTLEPALARRLRALLCEQPPPISGTFSGSFDYGASAPSVVGKLEWTGSLELEPLAFGDPPQFIGPTTFYELRAGTVTARYRLTSPGACTSSGQTTFVLDPGDAPGRGLEITEGNPETYRFSVQAGLVEIPTVTSGCPNASDNGLPGFAPIIGKRLLPFTEITEPFSIVREGEFAGSYPGSGSYAGYQWTWSLNG